MFKREFGVKNRPCVIRRCFSWGLVFHSRKLTEISEKETSAEILFEAKGFTGAVVSISDNMVDVVVGAETLSDSQLAQIEDIIIRKTGAAPENIIISPLSGK